MSLTKPRLYLLDVEGTTSPLSLVYEQLFPYARKHMEAFLRDHLHEPDVEADVAKLADLRRIQCAAAGQIDPLKLETKTRSGGFQGHVHLYTGVQAGTRDICYRS